MIGNIWEKKRFFDLWSIPHILFGVLAAFLPLVFGLSPTSAFFSMLTLALLWEVYEKFLEIKETVWNSILDILLPIVSFFVTYKLLDLYDIDGQQAQVIFTGVLIVYLFTNISGWLAYRHRKRDFIH